MVERAPRRAGWRTTTAGELVAECLGTFVLICFGDGVVAMAVAALNQSGRGTQIFAASGDWLIIGWGWGLAVAFAVYVAGGVSGAHAPQHDRPIGPGREPPAPRGTRRCRPRSPTGRARPGRRARRSRPRAPASPAMDGLRSSRRRPGAVRHAATARAVVSWF
jgi:major intrinsic protein